MDQMETQQCRKCKEIKPLEDFHVRSGTKRGRRRECKECHIITNIIWQREHPEYLRWKWILRKYSLTETGWNRIFDRQGRVCALCGSDNPRRKGEWCTDHNHKTGKVRGILCYPCNISIDHIKNIPLEKIKSYLVEE